MKGRYEKINDFLVENEWDIIVKYARYKKYPYELVFDTSDYVEIYDLNTERRIKEGRVNTVDDFQGILEEYNNPIYINLLQWHYAIEAFNYDAAVDWAVEQIEQGEESENLLIIASFAKPVDSFEIQPYITALLRERGLVERYTSYSIIANAHYFVAQIAAGHQVRANLQAFYKLCAKNKCDYGLKTFYLLHHKWNALETQREYIHYEEVTLENIVQVLKEKAQTWLDKYVDRK